MIYRFVHDISLIALEKVYFTHSFNFFLLILRVDFAFYQPINIKLK